MRRSMPAVLCLSLALFGCKAKELADKASISKDLQKTGTTDLMKQIADDEYTAPADGRLTEAQVQMYLKVRDHEKQIAQVAKEELKQHADKAEKKEKSLAGMMEGLQALGSAADFMTADIRAAKDLGFNTQEYLWVKGQVLAASTSVMAEKFNQTINANFDKAYAEAKKAYDEAKDEPTKKLYAEMIAGSKHENALNAYAQELSKYEDKPGQVQQGMKELEQKLEEAKKQ